MSGYATYCPLEHKIRGCGASTINSVPLKVVSAAAMGQINADGFESRLTRCINAGCAGPSGGGALELGGGGNEEGTALAIPGEELDGDGGAIHLKDIEGIEFAASAGGGGGSGVDDECGVARNFVTRCAFAGMANMQMAGEDEIDTAVRKASHGHVCASDQAVKLVGSRQIEGMVGYDDARAILAAGFEPRATASDLQPVDAATLKGERAGGIDADDSDFLIGVEGFEVLGDVALVIPKRFQGAGENVVQGHVVIAGDDNLR